MMAKFNELPKEFENLDGIGNGEFSLDKLEELEKMLKETLAGLGIDENMGAADFNDTGDSKF